MAEARETKPAGAVRPGEELPAAPVDAWLKARIPGLTGEPRITQFSGGASNWTYRLEYPGHDLVLRRPPAGTKAKSAHDMGREFTVQQRLRPVFPVVPEMIAHCEDPGIVGCEFYVMRRIPGIIPRSRMPVELTPDQARDLCHNVFDTLVALHRVDLDASGLRSLGKGAGYAARQIEGWSGRYRNARTWNVPRCESLIDWLVKNTPEDIATCMIHNDYRLDNVVLDPADPTRVLGVLDWEMATLGDPLMDLGNSLAYWVQANDDFVARMTRRQPSHLPGMLTRREILSRYEDRMGLGPRDWTFYEVYGIFRLMGIVQQIYYRYHHRQTRNPAFRHFWLLVHYFNWSCHRLISRRSGSPPPAPRS